MGFVRGVAMVAAAVAACAVVTSAGATRRTTEPGVSNYHVLVVLTDTSITLPRSRSTSAKGITAYPRGALIDFVLTNKGKHALSARLKLLSQHYFSSAEVRQTSIPAGKTPIQPGQVRHFAINFYFRGSFALQLMSGRRPLASAQIIIF
jgi:hypothetical protein